MSAEASGFLETNTDDAKDNATGMNTRKEYLSIHINDQMFGIPILQVQDVLGEQKITQIPLASSAIAGSLNLRGRIVTAIDVRKCLGLPRTETTSKDMSVVVEHNGELYSLIIDSIGDVLSLKIKDFEKNPATLDPLWRDISQGIFRLENNLLVVLDIPKLLSTIH